MTSAVRARDGLLGACLALGMVACGGGSTAGSTASPSSPPISAPTAQPAVTYWKPTLADTFQWQLASGIDTTVDSSVYDVDAFTTPASTVAELHTAGRHVVCYVNAGAYETYRPDAAQFPAAVLGKTYVGYPDEKWLDIRRIDLLAPIMTARFDLCKSKGFDTIEPDNIDGFENATGFPLTGDDQLAYNRWLADQAHTRGMSIALKNDGNQVAQLLPAYDFALVEDCWNQKNCNLYAPFAAAKKAVVTVEYTDMTTAAAFRTNVCPQAKIAGVFALLKNRNLDALRITCL